MACATREIADRAHKTANANGLGGYCVEYNDCKMHANYGITLNYLC
jgi:hypothetical protein